MARIPLVFLTECTNALIELLQKPLSAVRCVPISFNGRPIMYEILPNPPLFAALQVTHTLIAAVTQSGPAFLPGGESEQVRLMDQNSPLEESTSSR